MGRSSDPTAQPFSDPKLVSAYAEDTPRKVPGLADLHRMAMLLLAERAPAGAEILVLGAGGGLELKAFSEAQPSWRFVGVDPSAEMLELARRILPPHESRVRLQLGYVDDAPAGPFDGAVCLLVLHFLSRDERLHVLKQLRRRTRPGAPLVVAHHGLPARGEAARWLSLSAAFADRSGADAARSAASGALMAERLQVLSDPEEEELLREAGFSGIALFYAGLSFRGWVAVA
ncbi:class I SAM-dependent methyltransferase [Phenylobacterium terrae]|uniref:Class I SAM-dependent methyltransferase n=1 Tax=Phenylobacterium terrae TaxID=2665495 RepID=A0ABW4MX16_9CAUL